MTTPTPHTTEEKRIAGTGCVDNGEGDCPFCLDEACRKCGAGIDSSVRDCEHGIIERHGEQL